MARKVIVSPEAFAVISLHASCHSTNAVHGVLVGSYSSADDTVMVDHVFPICHETPTMPLLDTALALVTSELSNGKGDSKNMKTIVGWFTSPELFQDDKAGPVAMRIVANLAATSNEESDDKEPILIVLNSQKMADFFLNDDDTSANTNASECIQAYGKDFGKQWTMDEKLQVTVLNEVETTEKTKKLIKQGFQINDLTRHLEDVVSNDWHHSVRLVAAPEGPLQGVF